MVQAKRGMVSVKVPQTIEAEKTKNINILQGISPVEIVHRGETSKNQVTPLELSPNSRPTRKSWPDTVDDDEKFMDSTGKILNQTLIEV